MGGQGAGDCCRLEALLARGMVTALADDEDNDIARQAVDSNPVLMVTE